jgi:type I restriction enzyme S subunit
MATTMRPMLLSDVVRFGNGRAIKPGGEGRYPVYGSNGIIGGCDEFRYENGVIIGRVGAYCGAVLYCPEKFWASDNTLVAFPANDGFDTKFLFYLLHDTKLSNYAGGAAQPLVTQTVLKQVKVSVPPLPVQRRIAGILSAYDELMENSQRRIRLLEAMARALYREWFVHFRFPGHEKHPHVASPLGDIPQGWEVKKLADVADVNRAQINARSAPDELHYIDIASVSPGQIDSITSYVFADAPGRARRIVQHGDVLWSCVRPNRRSHAQVMHPEPDTIASTGFAVLTATKVPFTFLYFATTTDDFVAFLTNNATGSAYPAVSGATFEKADLLIPPAPLLKKFGAATIPMAEQIHALHRKIQNLRRTRDLLLPRLLSGQVNLAEN